MALQLAHSVLGVALAAASLAGPARGTTIVPRTFEELLFHAEFVGTVRCSVAGGIVADYEVVESWKGPAAGAKLRIRSAFGPQGPSFPLALVGEEFLVTALRAAASDLEARKTARGPLPVHWRDLGPDLMLPLSQGKVRLPLSGPQPFSALGLDSRFTTLDAVRIIAREFLALPEEAREAEVLRRAARAELGDAPALAAVAQAAAVGDLAQVLLRQAIEWPERERVRAHLVLLRGGRSTLAAVEEIVRVEPRCLESLGETRLQVLRHRVHGRQMSAPPADAAPTELEIGLLRDTLRLGLSTDGFAATFETLSRHDPGSVAEFLVRFENPLHSPRDSGLGAVLGSRFAVLCGRDRARWLTVLLGARDAEVQVAGAVYLCFEDRAAGVAALRERTALPGDAGGWAALALARRGERAAMDRALELLLAPDDPWGGDSHHRVLCARVLELLSNGAAASGVPPVPAGDFAGWYRPVELGGGVPEAVLTWWREHRDRIAFADPWLPLLAAQRID